MWFTSANKEGDKPGSGDKPGLGDKPGPTAVVMEGEGTGRDMGILVSNH